MLIDQAASGAWQLATVILEAARQPIFVVDAHRHLFFRNSRADEVMRAGHLFRVSGGRLAGVDRELTKGIEELVSELIAAGAGRSPLGPRTFLALRCHTPYLAFLAPVDFSSALPGRTTLGLLMLESRDIGSAMDTEKLRLLLGLSVAESRVAALIARGSSVAAVSADLGISVLTVRSHLKAIFRKSGVRRQQDLVRYAISAASLVLPDR